MKSTLSKNIKKPKKTLSKKKYKKPILKNKKILDIVVKEYKNSLSDSFIDKEEKPPKKLKIPKIDSNNFIDKEQTTKKIISNQLKIPKTNIFEVFVVCFGNLYNKVFINE